MRAPVARFRGSCQHGFVFQEASIARKNRVQILSIKFLYPNLASAYTVFRRGLPAPISEQHGWRVLPPEAN